MFLSLLDSASSILVLKIFHSRHYLFKIRNIRFTGGCNGNLKAIAKLCEGMCAEDIAAKLLGNTCGGKPTSCADQLARAVLGKEA